MRDSSKRSPSQIAELLRSGGGVRAVKFILCAALLAAAAGAQTSHDWRIDTFAGSRDLRDNGPATAAWLRSPSGVAVDGAGNLFIADTDNHRIRKVDSAGVITTVAGTGRSGFGGDGGPAVNAMLGVPEGVAADGAGNLFIADSYNNRIRKVDASGTITTIAGSGATGFALGRFGGDGGPATEAWLRSPFAVAVDGAGNVFIADLANDRIRKVDAAGVITTVAGTGEEGFSGDGGPAIQAALDNPFGVAVDGAGNLFITDRGNDRIRKVDAAGVITTVAGTGRGGFGGFSGDGGPATAAQLRGPAGVAVDGAGNLFIADLANHRIRKVDSAGVITTVAGTEERGDGGDGGPAAAAWLRSPSAVAVDGTGNLFIADTDNHRIRKVDSAGVITTVAGTEERGDGGPAVNARLWFPSGVAVDGAGNVYIADSENNQIRKVDSAGVITTVAGTGEWGSSGDGGLAVNARVWGPSGVAVDGAGNLFIAGRVTNSIRKVDSTGTITTIAGMGGSGFSGDGGPAVNARLQFSSGVAVDGAGNLFITDRGNHRIRKVDSAGVITTVAGTGRGGFGGFSGDGGPATAAQLRSPAGVAVDGAGNLFIADSYNNRIRKVDSAGVITTVAGTGRGGFSGDGGPATAAQLRSPAGVAVDGAGNLFITDRGNHRIRKVDSAGNITTVAGNGSYGFSGDGGAATAAWLGSPSGVAVDGAGNVYIADRGNSLVRKLTPVGGSDTPPAGTESFSIPDRGGRSTTSSGNAETLRVGYGRIRAEAGSTTPSGIAIFGLRQDGVLIAEAGVPATEPVQEGRIFAEVDGPVNTGLAIANPNDVLATIRFYFTDTSGTRFAEGSFELGAHQQTAKFLDQAPFNGGPSVLGTLTFTSSLPVAVVALRGFTNEAGEFLMTTLPVAPLVSASSDPVYFPHFADGSGWATQVVLVNPTDRTITGAVAFRGKGSDTAAAAPVILTLDDGRTGSNFDYSIAPRSVKRFTTSNPPADWPPVRSGQHPTAETQPHRGSLSFLLSRVRKPFRKPACRHCPRDRDSVSMSNRPGCPGRRARSEADWLSPMRGPQRIR